MGFLRSTKKKQKHFSHALSKAFKRHRILKTRYRGPDSIEKVIKDLDEYDVSDRQQGT